MISVSTIPWKNENPSVVVEAFDQMGFVPIELHLRPFMDLEFSSSVLKPYASYIDIDCLDGGWCNFFQGSTGEFRDYNAESIEKQVTIMRELREYGFDPQYLRLFLGSVDPEILASNWTDNVAQYMAEVFESYKDIHFLIETHGGASSDFADMGDLFDTLHGRFDVHNCGILFDPVNQWKACRDMTETYDALEAYIERVHIKELDKFPFELIERFKNKGVSFGYEYEGFGDPLINVYSDLKSLQMERGF